MRQWIVGALPRPATWLTLLAAWTTLSALRSFHTPWAQAALTEWLRWMAGIGLAVTIAYARPTALSLARTAAGLVAMIAIVSAWQGLIPAKGGLAGPFLDHQICGSALLILLPWTLALAMRDPSTKWRWSAQAISTTGLVCLALTLTRSAWAGAAVAALFIGGFCLTRIQDRARAIRQSLLGLALVLGMCAAFFLAIQPTELSAQFSKRTATLKALNQDFSWQARLPRWRGAARMAEAQPLWGWGLGRYPGLQSAWTGQGRQLGAHTHPSLSEQAHDLYLQTAAETGVLGLLLYLGVVLTSGGVCYQALRLQSPRREPLRFALLLAGLAALIGQSVDALASPSWQYGEVSLFWWASVGLVLQIVRSPLTAPAQSEPVIPPKRQRFFLMTSSAFLTPLAVAFFQPSLLLLPAEAYTPPTGWTYFGPTNLTADKSTANVGDTIKFSLSGVYHEAQGTNTVSRTADVSTDSTATYTISVTVNNNINSLVLCSSNTNGQNTYNIPSACSSKPTSGQRIVVAGYYSENGTQHHAGTTVTIRVN